MEVGARLLCRSGPREAARERKALASWRKRLHHPELPLRPNPKVVSSPWEETNNIQSKPPQRPLVYKVLLLILVGSLVPRQLGEAGIGLSLIYPRRNEHSEESEEGFRTHWDMQLM